jgi:hypothetical protein
MKTKNVFCGLMLGLLVLGSVGVGSSSAQTTGTTVSGLIHLWSGEGNAVDTAGAANGTLGSTTAFGTGKNGRQAFSFDGGQASIVSLPVNIGPTALPQMTMGMLVNLRSVANNRGWVIGHDNGGFDRSLNLTDDRYDSGVAGGTGNFSPFSSSLINLSENLNTWHCIAVSYDATLSTATFYADGITQTVPANPGEGQSTTTLGGLELFGGHTVDALVDEVFIFDRVLSAVEINQVCADFSNTPPTADAGGPYLVAVNGQVTFDGSGSSDPDNDSLTETWTADGGTVSGDIYTAGNVPGIYDVCLIVNDGFVDSDENCTMAVVYDPNGGFVTGGG